MLSWPAPAEDLDLFQTPNPRREPRLPFGALLEHGLLQPGDRLYYGADGQISAWVLADGRIEYNGTRGSIHQVARAAALAGPGPVNGWQIWYYTDPASGERFPLDRLRQQARALTHSQLPEDTA